MRKVQSHAHLAIPKNDAEDAKQWFNEEEGNHDGFTPGGPIPTHEAPMRRNRSTLPHDDWLRCKAALKMGRGVWDSVCKVKTEAEVAKESEDSSVDAQAAAGSPTNRRRSALGLDGRVKVRRNSL